MKRILLINKSLCIGGIEKLLITQYESLVKSGHKVDVLLFKNIIEFDIAWKDKINFVSNDLSVVDFVSKQEFEYDLIVCHAPSNSICKNVKKLKNEKVVFVLHGILSSRLTYGNFLEKYFRKKRIQHQYKNENLICVSNAVKNDALELGIKYKKCEIIYNYFNIPEIIDKSNEDVNLEFLNGRSYVVWVGRISKIKNLPYLIELYAYLSDRYDLVIVGDGDEDIKNSLQVKINNLKLNQKVHFIGVQKNPYVYMKNAAMFLLTSISEGFGNIIIESLCLNTPIFSVDIKAPREILSQYYPVGILPNKVAKDNAEYIQANKDIQIDTEKVILNFEIKNIAKQYLDYFEIKDIN